MIPCSSPARPPLQPRKATRIGRVEADERQDVCRSREFGRPLQSRPSRAAAVAAARRRGIRATHRPARRDAVVDRGLLNFTTRTVAAFNGVAEDACVYAGDDPDPDRGRGRRGAGFVRGSPTSSSSSSARPPPTSSSRREPLVHRRRERPLGRVAGRTQRPRLGLALLIGQTIQVPASSGSRAAAGTGRRPAPPSPPTGPRPSTAPAGRSTWPRTRPPPGRRCARSR